MIMKFDNVSVVDSTPKQEESITLKNGTIIISSNYEYSGITPDMSAVYMVVPYVGTIEECKKYCLLVNLETGELKEKPDKLPRETTKDVLADYCRIFVTDVVHIFKQGGYKINLELKHESYKK